METDAAVDKITDLQFLSTAAWKSLLAFRTVSTGSAAINLTHQNRTFHLLQKPDIFTCYRHSHDATADGKPSPRRLRTACRR